MVNSASTTNISYIYSTNTTSTVTTHKSGTRIIYTTNVTTKATTTGTNVMPLAPAFEPIPPWPR